MDLEVSRNRVHLPDRVLIFSDETQARTFAQCLVNFSLIECLEFHPPTSELATILSWETRSPRLVPDALPLPAPRAD